MNEKNINSKKKSRALNDELRNFILDEQSEARNAIVKYVKDNIEIDEKEKSVAMCFRGEYMCLYYRCHMLLMIKRYNKKIVGEFNFRHSRFTDDWDKKAARLKQLHVSNFKEKTYKDEDGSVKPYTFDSTNIRFDIVEPKYENGQWSYIDSISSAELTEILDIYKELIEDFVDSEKVIYQWQGEKDKPKKGDVSKNKSQNKEKNAQQKLYAQYFYREDAFIYDLEYTEPGLSPDEVLRLGIEDDEKVSGRFDLLGVVHEDGADVLEFIELKSTLDACKKKKSGVHSHIRDYVKYIDSYKRVKARMEEALDTITLLKKIFDIPFIPKPFKHPVRARIRFVFTGEAKEYEVPIVFTKYSEM